MMQEQKETHLIDYLVIFVRHKKFLIGFTFITMVIFYLAIFFFVDEKFDSTATIIPSQDNSMAGIAGMLGSLGGDLPFGLGSAANPEIGMYNTILSSRTTAESVIEKYDLWTVYELDPSVPKEVKQARETFLENLTTEETEDGAFTITIRTKSADLSADITNFLVDYLNKKIIDLKVNKSMENRIFLESRINDIRERLARSEDSLQYYQSESGMLNPEEQIKGLIGAYSLLEKDLIVKQLQKDVMEKILDEGSPQLQNLRIEVESFEKKLKDLREKGQDKSIFIPYETIPEKAINYFRYYREVEINNTILQFMLPLYEQAKIEEKKDTPVLQVIDYGKPAEEKNFPPRTIFTLIFGFIVFMFLFTYIIFKQNKELQSSADFMYIKNNLFRWKNSESES